MDETTVVNIRNSEYDVYIGRSRNKKFHFGSPFFITESVSREESVRFCEMWLRGTGFQGVEQERRDWILRNLHQLEGQRIGCF